MKNKTLNRNDMVCVFNNLFTHEHIATCLYKHWHKMRVCLNVFVKTVKGTAGKRLSNSEEAGDFLLLAQRGLKKLTDK